MSCSVQSATWPGAAVPFDPVRYRRERQDWRAAERLDVLEPPSPRRGCNLRVGARPCGRAVVARIPGYFGTFRACAEHEPRVRAHLRVLGRIRMIPVR